VWQENAELLTEEGRLLQRIQGDIDEHDVDQYAQRLDEVRSCTQRVDAPSTHLLG